MKRPLVTILLFLAAALPVRARMTRLAAIADTRGPDASSYVNTAVLNLAVDRILATNPPPAAVLVGGDLIYTPNNVDWSYRQFTDVMHRLVTNGIPYYCALGNHDFNKVSFWYNLWANTFQFPANGPALWSELAYTVDVGDVRVVMLDSVTGGRYWGRRDPYQNRIGSVQRDWLRTVTGPASPKAFDLVMAHQPAYPATTTHESDCLSANPADMEAFLQILVDAKVTAYLTGHEHLYCRRMVDARYGSNWTYTVPHLTMCTGAPLQPFGTNEPLPEATNNLRFSYVVIDLESDTLSGTARAYTVDTGELIDEVALFGKPPSLSLSFPGTILAEGLGTLTNWAAVLVSGTSTSDVTVTLHSSDSGEISVTNTVIVPAGDPSATFDLRVMSDVLQDGLQTVILTAAADGYAAATGIVEVADTGGAVPRLAFGSAARVDRVIPVYANTNMQGPILQNFSSCALMPDTGELLVVCKGYTTDERILVFSTNGVFQRDIRLTYPDFNDVEGISLVDAGTRLFALAEEGQYDQITLVHLDTNTTVLSNADGEVLNVPLPFGKDVNKGMEGVAYDALNDCFYAVQEKLPTAAGGGVGVFRVRREGSNAVTEVLFDAQQTFAGVATDLSDLAYDPFTGHLFLLSHEANRLFECDMAGRILASLALPTAFPWQPEGVVLSPRGDELHIVAEPNQYYRFQLQPLRSREGEGTNVEWQAVLSRPAAETVTASYVVSSLAAQAGVDFTPAAGTVEFPPGVVTAAVSLVVSDDGETEPDEVLVVGLTNVAHAALAHDAVREHTIEGDRVRLLVQSPLGTASPPVGTNAITYGTVLACAVLDSPVATGAGTQAVCIAWIGSNSVPSSGEGSLTPGFVITNDSSIAWFWETNVWLETTVDGGGTVSGGNRWLPPGTNVLVEARTNRYFAFDGWSGDLEAGADTNSLAQNLTMDRSRSVAAHFPALLAPGGTPQWWLAQYYGDTNDFGSLETSDTDHDTYKAWQEYIADTVPTSAMSRLRLSGIERDSNGCLLAWPGSTARVYSVFSQTDLASGATQLLNGSVTGQPSGTTFYLHAPATNGQSFYRINARVP